MSEFTPGPWRVHSFSTTEHVIPEVWGVWGDEYSDHIKRIEDARLIAAAPDLLAALQSAVEMPVRTEGPDWWSEVFAAINKATGA